MWRSGACTRRWSSRPPGTSPPSTAAISRRRCAQPTAISLALEPRPGPLPRLALPRRRARVAEADEVLAVQRIEIDARRRRHVGFLEHALGEFEAVVAEALDVGIEIEGAVDGEDFLDAGLGQ